MVVMTMVMMFIVHGVHLRMNMAITIVTMEMMLILPAGSEAWS